MSASLSSSVSSSAYGPMDLCGSVLLRDEGGIGVENSFDEADQPPADARTEGGLNRRQTKDDWDDPQLTYISRLYVTLQNCLNQLGASNVTSQSLEQMSIFIHESMSATSRNYHSVQHVFDISKIIEDPIGILAALFHDCIYLTVDGGLTAVQQELITNKSVAHQEACESFIAKVSSHGRLSILGAGSSATSGSGANGNGGNGGVDNIEARALANERKRHQYLVQSVFGYEQNDKIEVPVGINEFYSALVAVRFLSGHLENEDIAKICCCIEATIPFRNTPTSSTAMERLYNNMVKTRESFQLKLTDEEIVEAVQLAATLANEDVGNFGSSDRLYFLDNTWSLLPELNLKLRAQFLYTAFEFQEAMHKMNGFFGFLNPTAVFASYKGVPNQLELAELISQCTTNLKIGKKYVGAKYLSASFLAAVAQLTGGDAPLSMFMGDLPGRNHQGYTLEKNILTKQDAKVGKEHCDEGFCDPVVYDILLNGRRKDTQFDIKKSPLAAYLYGMIGEKGLQNLLQKHVLYPMNEERALDLLHSLPVDAVTHLTENMAYLTVPRIHQLKVLTRSFKTKNTIQEDEIWEQDDQDSGNFV